ncbi:Tyrosine--tRNA ligase (Tyr-tRNA) [Candidatus Vidania fulgoroideae]|nr:Tyrosine--tRNA ligase (Tyr-tRNA) [Candidatus Vidania fulgoroideae]
MKKSPFPNFYLFEEIIKITKKESLFFEKRKNLKFGIDLTKNSLHIGHLFILLIIKRILRFKNVKIFIVLGDFTTFINNKIKKKKILENLKEIKKQIKGILGNHKRIKYLKNSKWLKKISLEKISKEEANFFLRSKKILKKKKKKIGQIIYPYLQNFDSNFLKIDIELGGEDQFFNFLYENKKRKKKMIFFILPLIKGIRGEEKMSKSNEENQINLNDNYKKIFWKFINMSDYNSRINYNLFKRIIKFKKIKHNLNIEILKKINLFMNIGSIFLNKRNINYLLRKFINRKYMGSKKKLIVGRKTNIIDLFIKKGLLCSKKQVKELIKQGAIKVNNKIIREFNFIIKNNDIISCGKKKKYLIKIEKRRNFSKK